MDCNGCDADGDGQWDGPVLIEKSVERDGSYWLLPEMYVDYEDFQDEYYYFKDYDQDPYNSYYDEDSQGYFQYLDSLYFLPFDDFGGSSWSEEFIFGGSDRFYGTSNALTNEVRFDLTSQFTNEWRARFGFDIKSHKLDFYEVENPWDDAGAFTQRFAEQWDDFGQDGIDLFFKQNYSTWVFWAIFKTGFGYAPTKKREGINPFPFFIFLMHKDYFLKNQQFLVHRIVECFFNGPCFS